MALAADRRGQQRFERNGVRCRAGELLARFAQLLQWHVLQGQLHVLRHGLGHVDGNNGLQRGIAAQDRQLLDGLVPHDGHAGTVVVELATQLMRGVQRVVRHDGCAETQHCQEGNDELGAVRHDQRDAIARANTEGLQAGGTAADLLVQLGVGDRAAEEPHSVLVGPLGKGLFVQVQKRVVAEIDFRGGPLRVARQPGFFLKCRQWSALRNCVSSVGRTAVSKFPIDLLRQSI